MPTYGKCCQYFAKTFKRNQSWRKTFVKMFPYLSKIPKWVYVLIWMNYNLFSLWEQYIFELYCSVGVWSVCHRASIPFSSFLQPFTCFLPGLPCIELSPFFSPILFMLNKKIHKEWCCHYSYSCTTGMYSVTFHSACSIGLEKWLYFNGRFNEASLLKCQSYGIVFRSISHSRTTLCSLQQKILTEKI